jgi:hypothetical protein
VDGYQGRRRGERRQTSIFFSSSMSFSLSDGSAAINAAALPTSRGSMALNLALSA